MTSIYDFTETEMNGKEINLKDYTDKVVIIVNTASKCGLAPQLEGLEALYKKYQGDGLVVLGLPSNQFKQELDTDEETSDYCQVHYGVTFPMTKRVMVNGKDEDELFAYLKDMSGNGSIKWNYTKFLIGRDGQLIHRYAPITTPEKMEKDIIAALGVQV
ncbi:glutathione peroxidase [Weissella paramesenteroides]|jgi:glutathione peroxidase|uniref:glutathione peroxidase n=1 Tax=Weissella paramesenteroides TaxID=1249 RepID=UPI002073307A|nr:glutathione peroxidase [Weissella paramesenteroides]MCM6764936.1 glutathione peroxidase [Weissella paramesenteroides]MCM6767955.1 glutathione peroxidase [Weissella paramesenteroides]MCM6768776.1 glutathione peroxidase [Weissella paramesenteroides]MCM6770875.1 glutathione peroxidase [Weissella paramesenteroides]MCM6780796.1 glutathione peroxidase [Weissella paramesenteroides]